MKKKLQLIALAVLCPFFWAEAQQKTPLQIGDSVPDRLWNLPLQVVSSSGGKDTITLGDYRGKLIILDFWATWCAPCVKSLPFLDSLQSEFPDELKLLVVSSEKTSSLAAFLKRPENAYLKADSVDIYKTDQISSAVLSGLFPHSSIPHTVIIGRQGDIKAISTPEYISRDKITSLLQSDSAYIPLKREKGSLKAPFLSISPGYPQQTSPVFYSMLTGRTEGVMPASLEENRGEMKRILWVNQSLLSLYAVATARGGLFLRSPNRRLILGGKAKKPALLNSAGAASFQSGKYTYEAMLPVSITDSAKRAMMKAALDNFLHVSSSITRRKLNCWIITGYRSGAKDSRRLPGGSQPASFHSLKSLIGALNTLAIPPVFARSGMKDSIRINLPAGAAQLPAPELRSLLAAQGIQWKEEVREVEMLVLSDNENGGNATTNLTLTPAGYVSLPQNPDL